MGKEDFKVISSDEAFIRMFSDGKDHSAFINASLERKDKQYFVENLKLILAAQQRNGKTAAREVKALDIRKASILRDTNRLKEICSKLGIKVDETLLKDLYSS